MEREAGCLPLSYRKLLFLIHEAPVQDDGLTFFYRAAALAPTSPLHCPVADGPGPSPSTCPRRVAFFPAPSTPSPLSHQGDRPLIGTWASRSILRWMSSPGPRRPSPT